MSSYIMSNENENENENLHKKMNQLSQDHPSLPQCFDHSTLLEMNDGHLEKITDIKVGDLLKNGNEVTAVLKLKRTTEIMYHLDGTIVSDTHIVYDPYIEEWLYVHQHPNAKRIPLYDEPFIYCLNTSSKKIEINENIFLDWDEIYYLEDKRTIQQYVNLCRIQSRINSDKGNSYQAVEMHEGVKKFADDSASQVNQEKPFSFQEENVHRYLDGGLSGSTLIPLQNGKKKELKDIDTDDVLEKGEKVMGLVKIDGSTLAEQYVYVTLEKIRRQDDPFVSVEENILVEGASNLIFKTPTRESFSTLFMDLDQEVEIDYSIDFGSRYHKLKNDKSHQQIFLIKRRREKKEDILYHLITDRRTFTIGVGNIQTYHYSECIDFFLD